MDIPHFVINLMDIWIDLLFWAIMNKASMNIYVQVLYG